MSDYLDLPTISETSCNNCGACCLHIGIPPFVSYDNDDFDFQALPRHLRQEIWLQSNRELAVADVPLSQAGDKPCIWLDMETRQCRQYEHRPFFCREFRPGSDVCLDDRALCGINI